MTSPYTIRELGPDDGAAVVALDRLAFFQGGGDSDPEDVKAFEWDRTFGAVTSDGGADGKQLVGVHSAYSIDLPVPGGSVAAGGLTWVGVHPGWRRRGVMTALVTRHLDEVRRRGEPVSALTASEPMIYGRFGYGPATDALRATVPRGAELRPVAGADAVRIRIEPADVDRHESLVADCYAAYGPSRPGMASREGHHRRVRFEDTPAARGGAEALMIMVAEADDDGPARGFALFARTPGWTRAGSPDGTVHVRELVARDPAAARALWGRLTDLDLTSTVTTGDRAVDDPLFTLLVDARRAGRTPADGLYVRLVDVPAALAARRYQAEVDVVLEVVDARYPENAGRWHLVGGPDHASCTATTGEPALTLDVRELGSAYLGGRSLTALAAAGLVQVTDARSLLTSSSGFGWPVAPWGAWRF